MAAPQPPPFRYPKGIFGSPDVQLALLWNAPGRSSFRRVAGDRISPRRADRKFKDGEFHSFGMKLIYRTLNL